MLWILIMTLTGCTQGDLTHDTVSNNEELGSYESFFTEDIHRLNITIAPSDFQEILDNPEDEAFYSANITLDGVGVDQVGFRVKGNSTLKSVANSESERYSFKIKVDKYVDDQDLLGLDEFVVNNMFSDVSYLREYISYKALVDEGEIASMTSFVNVYVNDELYGFYLLVESVDDSFLERNFGDNDGNLYRADQGTSLEKINGEYIENSDQKNGEDESKEDLHNLIDVLNQMPNGEKGEIESVLDVDSALKYIAFNTLLENYDSLSGKHVQNYYLYNDKGVFTVIPWDLNMSFGGFGGTGMISVDIDEPVYGTDMSSRPLIENLLAVEDYKNRYYKILENYIDYFASFEEDIVEIVTLIRPGVSCDPSKFFSTEAFENSVVYDPDGSFESQGVDGGEKKGDRNGMGEKVERPEGNRSEGGPTDGMGQRPEKMGNGGLMVENNVSIVNILIGRIENVKDQLASKDY